MAKNTGQSPDYNPNANGYSDGYSGQGRLVNQQSIIDPKDNMMRPTLMPTDGGFKPSVIPPDGGYRYTLMPEPTIDGDLGGFGGNPPVTGGGLPPEVGMADLTPPPILGIHPIDIPMSGGEVQQDPVATQPDYGTQTEYEAFTPPDPASNTQNLQDTIAEFGGGAAVTDPAQNAQSAADTIAEFGGGAAVDPYTGNTAVTDPAQNAQSAAATIAEFGGGAVVDPYTGDAEQYLTGNRTLNDVSGGEEARSAAESAIYDSMASRLDPQYAQQANDLEISLRNRGLSEGDAAFDSAMDNFNRAKTDAYKQANWQAIQGGGQEAQRNQQMDLDRRAQMFGEALGMSQQEIDKNRDALQAQAAQNQFSLGMAGVNQAASDSARNFELQNQQMANQFSLGMGGLNQQQQAAQNQFSLGMAGVNQAASDSARNFELQNQQMANQFSLGMGGLNQQQRAADRAYDLGSQAQGFNQQMQGANYANQLRQQQISEEMMRRNQSLNELNALLTGSQVSQPNFQGYNQAGNAGGTDYSGAAQNQYQSTLDSFNANNSMWQGLMSGAGSMYGAGMFSDERLKDNIVKVGEYKGVNLYTWTWNSLMPEVFKRGKAGFGVLAQEIEKVMPSAVIEHASGFKQVKYSEVF